MRGSGITRRLFLDAAMFISPPLLADFLLRGLVFLQMKLVVRRATAP